VAVDPRLSVIEGLFVNGGFAFPTVPDGLDREFLGAKMVIGSRARSAARGRSG